MSDIHPTAIISDKAKIGNNVTIGPFCYIDDNVEIGDDSVLDSSVRIEGITKIGKRNHFYHSAVIGTSGQDLKYKGEPTKLTIGDNNIFREFITVSRASTPDSETTIGSNCYLMSYCHIAHDCHIGDYVIMANVATLGGHITIEDYATLGGLTAVHQFVRIGKYAFIGGVSGVKKDVPPFVRGEGTPFRPIGLNSVGLSRKGFSTETIQAIRRIYKIFYDPKLNVSQAMKVAEEMQDIISEQQYFIDFVRNSQRGICK